MLQGKLDVREKARPIANLISGNHNVIIKLIVNDVDCATLYKYKVNYIHCSDIDGKWNMLYQSIGMLCLHFSVNEVDSQIYEYSLSAYAVLYGPVDDTIIR